MAELFLTSAGSQWTSGAELWAAIRTPGTLRKVSEAFKPDPQSRESYVLSDACIARFCFDDAAPYCAHKGAVCKYCIYAKFLS